MSCISRLLTTLSACRLILSGLKTPAFFAGVGVLAFTAHGQDSRIDGRLVIDLHYTETDILSEKDKDDIGETTRHSSTQTSIDLHESHSIRITKDTEGESFLVMEDPEKTLSGAVNYTFKGKRTHHSYPDGPDFPTDVSNARGSASGTAVKEQVGGANIDHAANGKDLMVTIPVALKIEQASYRNKSITHHWQGLPPNRKLVEDTAFDDISPLPNKGQTDIPGFTLRPTPSGNEGPQPDPASDFGSNIWYGAKTQKLPKGGYTITCSGTISDPDAAAEAQASTPGKSITHTHRKTISATVTIIPGPKPPADLFIEPVDLAVYDNWMPRPVCDAADVQKIYGDADTLTFKATIKPKDPAKPVAGAPMDFYLVEVSKNQGRSGNEPKAGADPDPKPGLRFSKNQGTGVHVDPDNPQHAYIVQDVTEGTVVVEAIDAGAYGKLQVTADSNDLVGVYKRTGEKFVPIPRDDNANHIADAWEKQNHIFDKNYAATWDEDNVPDTGPANKGDGLTLYEEYRGFATLVPIDNLEQKVWVRLQPGVKHLFVYAQGDDNKLFKMGARLYESVQGTKVHFIFDDDGVAKDDLGTTRYVNRWFNFNSSTDDGVNFKGRMFAVNIINDSGEGVNIFTAGAPNTDQNNILSRPPEQVEAIHLSRPYVEGVIAGFIRSLPPARNMPPFPPIPSVPVTPNSMSPVWMEANAALKIKGIDVHLSSIGYHMQENKAKLVDQYIVFSVMHELGHATGAVHHGLAASLADNEHGEDYYFSSGDVNCPMRYWDTDERRVVDNFELRLRFFAGLWNPALGSPEGVPWHFCDKKDCTPTMHLIKR